MPPLFQPFGFSHFVVILLSFAIVFLVYRSRDWHYRHQKIVLKIISWGGLSFFPIHFLGYFFVLQTFDIRYDLPILQICGITLACSSIFLLTKKAKLQEFTYNIILFWGVSAMLASFLTPALAEGFPHIYFWLFWLSHWAIVYILSYIFIVKPRNIDYQSLWQSVSTLIVFALIIYPFNLFTNSNYAFLVTKPAMIQFGVWGGIDFDQSPAYIFPALGVIIILFHLIYGTKLVLERAKS